MATILEHHSECKDVKHEEGVFFRCHMCEETKPVQTNGGTGYAYDNAGRLMCYQCCAKVDREYMIEKGKIILYLTCEPANKAFDHGRRYNVQTINCGPGRNRKGKVTNWPGTLEFPCSTEVGRHNIARWRYDCWFTGPDGFIWHGVTYGDNTQICHCKRTKERRS